MDGTSWGRTGCSSTGRSPASECPVYTGTASWSSPQNKLHGEGPVRLLSLQMSDYVSHIHMLRCISGDRTAVRGASSIEFIFAPCCWIQHCTLFALLLLCRPIPREPRPMTDQSRPIDRSDGEFALCALHGCVDCARAW